MMPQKTQMKPMLAAATLGLALVLVGPSFASPASTRLQPQMKRLVVGDLALRVPVEWQRVAGETPPGGGVFMIDPKHRPARAVTFSVASSPVPMTGVLALGQVTREGLDERFTDVRARLVHLPRLLAYQISFDVKLESKRYVGVKYVVVHRNRGYVLTYEAIASQAATHMPQFRASARSMRHTRGPYNPDIRSVTVARTSGGVLSISVRFRHPITFRSNKKLQVLLDTDRNRTTGVEGGEYALDFSGSPPTADLLTARNGNVTASQPRSLQFSSTPTSATFEIDVKEIGAPKAFNFWLFVSVNGTAADMAPSDDAPPPDTSWTYPPVDAATSAGNYPKHTYINP